MITTERDRSHAVWLLTLRYPPLIAAVPSSRSQEGGAAAQPRKVRAAKPVGGAVHVGTLRHRLAHAAGGAAAALRARRHATKGGHRDAVCLLAFTACAAVRSLQPPLPRGQCVGRHVPIFTPPLPTAPIPVPCSKWWTS